MAAWLGVVAAGLIAVAYSQGRGSSAFKAAVLAVVYVGAERVLHRLRDRHPIPRRAWPLYRRPLLVSGWIVSGGTILLALVRNLWLLGGGPGRENWAIAGLLTIVALYAASAYLFRRPLFLWLAAPLLFAPWTLLTHRGWYVWDPPLAPRYALAWAVLAWVLILAGLALECLAGQRAGRRYGLPLRVTAHILLPFALAWGSADPATSSATLGLGVVFYVLAALLDCRRGRTGHGAARFAYPAAFLVPVWAVYLLAWRGPWLPHAHFGLLLLSLASVLFAIARRLHRVDPTKDLGRPLSLPVYLATYGCAVAGTMLVSYERSLLTLALLFDAGLALTSAWRLRERLWVYPAAALPPVALVLALAEAGIDPHRRGWWLIGLGVVYLAQSWGLRRTAARSYAAPLMAAAYAIVALGLPVSSYDQIAALGAYSAASAIYAISAVWLQEPLLLTPAVGLIAVPYAILLDRIPWITPAGYGIALLSGVALALAIAHGLDRMAATGTIDGLDMTHAFPWDDPARWLPEAARRLTGWWALSFYLFAYIVAAVAVALSLDYPIPLILTLASATGVYGLATARFRLRGWLLAAAASAQLTALAIIHAAAEGLLGLPPAWIARLGYTAWQAAAFLPVSLVTAAAGLAVERRRGEGSPLADLGALWRGCSRPFYWLLALDLTVVQIIALTHSGPATLVSTTHALLLAALAVAWSHGLLPYLAAGLGLLAVIANQFRVEASATSWPWVLALLALGYGLLGYGLEYVRAALDAITDRFKGIIVLEKPLERASCFISAVAILNMATQGARIWRWLFRSLFLGQSLMTTQNVRVVQMAVATLSILGLLYLAIGLVRRWYWLGYGAVGLLLAAWSLEWFLVWDLREIQWYAIPAGVYLLVIGYLEWGQDRRGLARWIDRAALLLLLGSAFYQSLAEPRGWPYALLMGAESFLIIWWGSARRQLRFLYAGVIGIVSGVGGQLIEPLLSVNAWLVFGGVGLFVLLLSIFIERSLEAVRRLSEDVRQRLEDWE
ncbi:MAG TPA: hypothetical protein ENN42_09835 [Thioalkalivibrio sp.]|nr:hypothetical protein [Thioalkalivibrio sp.]